VRNGGYIYLAKASAVERTAYLREIGLVQRFEALDPQDRAAVQAGWPRVGMSAEALRFVWGEPYHTKGDPRRSAHWYYLGSSFGRSAYNNPRWGFGGTHLRRDTVIPQWFQASKAAAASDGHAVHC
jgi:hypothetical protein